MAYVFVLAKDGTKLMPTHPAHARKLLKKGKAVIASHHPFTIRLTRESEKNTQPIELCMDTGSQHIGISVKSEKHEYLEAQFDNLSDEKERHDAQRKTRRSRRSRKRYRKARFSNRKKEKKWIAPSLQHKADNHERIARKICQYCPVKVIWVEVGTFDTQLLAATEKAETKPEGKDYQQGDRLGYRNTREAVFARDSYTCQICHKGIRDGAILRIHHIGFLKKDRSNRMDNLLTVCTKCHTAKNHKPGGKLYGLKPKLKTFRGAAFVNTVRWLIVDQLKLIGSEVRTTYGYLTKESRIVRNIPKSHAFDAYAMGDFHPKHCSSFEHYAKRRRNGRKLEKFYDAKYVDIRDGEKKSGSQLSSGRTNRSEPRTGEKNERIYRGEKTSRGRRTIRKKRYPLQPGDTVLYAGQLMTVKGMHCHGTRAILANGKSVSVEKLTCIHHAGGWAPAKS